MFSTMYQGTRPLVAKKAAEKEMCNGLAVDNDNNCVLSETSNEMLRQRKDWDRSR